ncbi:MAG TPA: FAD-dependent oxidoreductase [Solirubrobacteraceae bacterium]|nr:FAD-dependent oxidoreductase [Solirubrobacteraceae bacterium]
MSKQTFAIVGASLAGAKAAEELRKRGFDGEVVLIGADPERPYERPPLSKDHLRGESETEQAFVHEAGFYDEQEIRLITGHTVTALDIGERRIELDDGHSISFDKLLLTTGAEPRRIQVPGADLEEIYYLRTLADSDSLRDRIERGGRLAVVGAGWIGSEVAASARQKGVEVTLIDPLALPNERIFGPEIGAFYRDVHAQHGVELALEQGVDAFEGEDRVSAVRTSVGRTIECDFAVVGVGVVPALELARAAGLDLDNGIAVDDALRTSAPNVFAAGDVANAWHPFFGRRLRLEHWSNALNQGPAAARSMLGEAVSYDRIPYFFSDQYEVGMEYSGFATDWDEVVFRGDRDAGEFVAFWIKDSRVIAGMNVNVWDVNEHVQALVRSRQPVESALLRDPDTALTDLIPAADTQ